MSFTEPPAASAHASLSEEASPLLTLVTVCFNSASTIEETLDSVDAVASVLPLGQIEHLVIDGLSKDATLRIVQSHRSIFRRVVSEKDSGIYDAMNKGLRLARGRYIWFLNSDDLLDPRAAQWFPALLQRLRAGQAPVVVGEISMFRDVAGRRHVTRVWRLPAGLHLARRLGWHPPHPAFIADRSLLLRLGGFDESKRIAADFKLMIATLDHVGSGVERFPHNLTMMREGGVSNGSMRGILQANAECYRAQRELGHGAFRSSTAIALKLTRKVMQVARLHSRKVAP